MTFQRKHYWMGALFVQMTFFGCSHLATIEADLSAQVLLDALSFCTDEHLWIGLNDQAVEGTWEYADGTACPGCATSPYWNDGEPNNSGDEDCAEVYLRSTIYNMLNDVICTNDRAFACNKPTAYPIAYPTAYPTAHPTVHPTTTRPTIHPTVHPATVHPTSHPTTASPYIFVNVLKTWDEAEDYCQSMYDSHLATIEDDLSAQALLDGCSF
eukprot:916410_1